MRTFNFYMIQETQKVVLGLLVLSTCVVTTHTHFSKGISIILNQVARRLCLSELTKWHGLSLGKKFWTNSEEFTPTKRLWNPEAGEVLES